LLLAIEIDLSKVMAGLRPGHPRLQHRQIMTRMLAIDARKTSRCSD
jgi:hypothetical protein